MKNISFASGPAIVITAAFIGPGSLTICAIAGVDFGYELLWAVLLSCLITIFFQNTIANLSFKTGKGLVELLNDKLKNSVFRYLVISFVLISIFFGNAAYEAGNITGAYIGLENLIKLSSLQYEEISTSILLLIITTIIMIIVWRDNNRLIKNILGVTVLMMSISFLIASILTKPDIYIILDSFLTPRWRPESWKTIVAVLGTTVVPYNLFLHAALVKKDKNSLNISYLRRDTFIAVAFGGIISSSIIIAAAGSNIDEIQSINDLGNSLSKLYGSNSSILISIGLFCAGLSSAITAPIAAGYVVEESLKNFKYKNIFKKIAIYIVVFTGLVFAKSGYQPIELIRIAQIANGLLLPLITLFVSILCLPKKNDFLILKIRFLIIIILFILFTFLAFKVLFL